MRDNEIPTMRDNEIPSKLAPITAAFWVTKIAATTLGETAGDLVSMTLNVGYALSSLVLLSLFGISLASQLAAKRYHPWLYWTVILTTSTAGTTMSDFMDRSLGFGYAAGSAILIASLLAVFTFWRITVGSLTVDPRCSPASWRSARRSRLVRGPSFLARLEVGA
jgi:uncharacterized membrane-anchored protein